MTVRVFSASPLLLSTVIAAWIGLRVARRIHMAGVEHYSGRLLILAAITNTISVALLLLLLGAMTLRHALSPGHLRGVGLAIALLFLLLPIRVVWNYVKASARIRRRLGLTPLGTEDHRMEVAGVAK